MKPPSDPFALLGLARRPWLDPESVRVAFQGRARPLHPDSVTGDADRFAELNEARRLVADPAARLSWLARVQGGEVPSGHIMPADAEFGFSIAACLREADAFTVQLAAAAGPLARAVLMAGKKQTIAALQAALRQADEKLHSATVRLRALDARWPDCTSGEIFALSHEFAFLQKWRSQISDRLVAIETA